MSKMQHLSSARSIASAVFCGTLLLTTGLLAQRAETNVTSNKEQLSAKINSLQNDESTNPHELAVKVVDKMTIISKQTGNEDAVEEATKLRERFTKYGDVRTAILVCENSVDLLKYLREYNDLVTADGFLATALPLATCIKNAAPRVFIAIQFEAAQLDVEFERYKSAKPNFNRTKIRSG
jgi:hypothetical protein